MAKLDRLNARKAITDACVAKFNRRPLQYGTFDCWRLALFVIRKAKVKVGFMKGRTYGSENKALAHMDELGFSSMIDVMDATGLERIAPAMSLPADIMAFPASKDSPFGAALYMVIRAGGSRALGLDPITETFDAGEPDLSACLAAWSLPDRETA